MDTACVSTLTLHGQLSMRGVPSGVMREKRRDSPHSKRTMLYQGSTHPSGRLKRTLVHLDGEGTEGRTQQ